MSQQTFSIRLVIVVFILGVPINSISQTQPPTRRQKFSISDIAKLRWIEGTWRGTGDGQPFFERYRFERGSTLAVDSFADGKMTQVRETTLFELKDGELGGGNEGSRWVATFLGVDSIDFAPVAKANNSFTWRRETRDSWVAILEWPAANGKPARQRIYKMERWPEGPDGDLTRAYVAASGKDKRLGQDKKTCPIDSPCQTIKHALETFNQKTYSGSVTIIENGEYDVFDIGEKKNLAGEEIHIAVTVEAAPGVVATITTGGPNQGAYIHIGSQDRVVLRNLHFEATLGNVGVGIKKGRWVFIDGCSFSNYNVAIIFISKGELFVTNSVFKRNGDGLIAASEFNGNAWTTDAPSVSIDNCRFELESRSAVSVKDGAQAVMRNTVITGTSTYGVLCDSDRKDLLTKLFIENSSITGGAFSCIGICLGDGIGLQAGGGKANVEVTLSNSVITQNKVGIVVEPSATVLTYRNNRINSNGFSEADNVRGKLTEASFR